MTPFVSWGITVRMVFALVSSFGLCCLIVPFLIRLFRKKEIGQSIRDQGVQEHKKKSGTPTMGGIGIVIAVLVCTLLWTKPSGLVFIALFALVFLGLLGFLDDYMKVKAKQYHGLSARGKLLGQILFSGVLGWYLYTLPNSTYGQIYLPYFGTSLAIGALYVPFVVLVIVGASNAVNLTDGLDGLAAGIVMVVTLCYGGISYLAGHAVGAEHMQIPPVPGGGELAIFCTAIAGACAGFLWFNSHPAAIFMGDTGSLALGGALGTVAVLARQELLLVVIGGIFVVEAASVIIQVASFKTTGKRVFLMSPIHHHFEKAGWPETKVVIRFWIVTFMLALLGLSLLGLAHLPD